MHGFPTELVAGKSQATKPPRQKLTASQRAALPRVNIPPIPIGPRRSMDMFPRKYSECLEHNQKIKICCRHMENITGQMYHSPSCERNDHGDPLPDIFIATCSECGCNHYRMAVGSG